MLRIFSRTAWRKKSSTLWIRKPSTSDEAVEGRLRSPVNSLMHALNVLARELALLRSPVNSLIHALKVEAILLLIQTVLAMELALLQLSHGGRKLRWFSRTIYALIRSLAHSQLLM